MLTKEDVENYVVLDAQRKKLQREIDAIEREKKALKEQLLEHVRTKGGSDRTTVFHGFILAIKTAAGFPAWKTAFIEQLGSAAAEKVAKAVPTRDVLQVEKAAA